MALLSATRVVVLLSAVACSASQSNCPEFCTKLWAPVCGSDGVSYGNACIMRGAACRSGKTIQVENPGSCRKESGDATPPTAFRHKRQCPKVCAKIYSPVCGSDGKTYVNECEMNVAACQTGASIKILNYGVCRIASRTLDTASLKNCNIMCPMNYDPVCASDGNTYGNECSMNSAACELGQPMKVVSRGECPVKDVAPKATGQNEDCSGFCPMLYFPVCGTDGNTYGNECEMKYRACKSNKPIKVARQGACTEKAKRANANACQTVCIALYAPVCGSDGQTYSNECVLKASACQKGVTSLTVASQGECTAVTDTCKVVPCPKIYDPVCGSDKKIYGNQCLFSNAQCSGQQVQGKKLEEMSMLYCTLSN